MFNGWCLRRTLLSVLGDTSLGGVIGGHYSRGSFLGGHCSMGGVLRGHYSMGGVLGDTTASPRGTLQLVVSWEDIIQ